MSGIESSDCRAGTVGKFEKSPASSSFMYNCSLSSNANTLFAGRTNNGHGPHAARGPQFDDHGARVYVTERPSSRYLLLARFLIHNNEIRHFELETVTE